MSAVNVIDTNKDVEQHKAGVFFLNQTLTRNNLLFYMN